jgi:probable rRNA maturation factor
MSREFGWTPRQEVAYYVIHGLLHLTGYDDLTVADRRAMRARERAVMRAIGMPAPPRTRSRRSRS